MLETMFLSFSVSRSFSLLFMGGGVSRGTFVKVLRSVKVFKVSKVLRPFENDGGFVCSWWILNLVFFERGGAWG